MKDITLQGRRWFDGNNTYHSVTISVDNVDIANSGIHYGYDNQYVQTGLDILKAHKLVPDDVNVLWHYCQDNGIVLHDNVLDVKRRKDL